MTPKLRLDQLMLNRGMVNSRSQAENYIKLGHVSLDGQAVDKPGMKVSSDSDVKITAPNLYVSRAALKLDSVVSRLALSFLGKVVLDVGSSTGGFTDYVLRHGASHVVAVEVGKDQLHPSLRNHPKIELHERTDIRSLKSLSKKIDIALVDVSFISLREVLPAVVRLVGPAAYIVAMLKPQFEAGSQMKNKGVIKNSKVRRQIIADFEAYIIRGFKIINKADSRIKGQKGNTERFYLLKPIR